MLPPLSHTHPSTPPRHVIIFSPTQSLPSDPEELSPMTLCNEYGKEDMILTIVQALKDAGVEVVEVLPVTLQNFGQLVEDVGERRKRGEDVVVFNLCDGTEDDGYPGASVVSACEKLRVPFTGASLYFFEVTTSKPTLKEMLISDNVATSRFVEVKEGKEREAVDEAEKIIGWPLIVKPSGREFTAVVVGDSVTGVKAFPVAERVFHAGLKKDQRILAFDRYWDGYDLQGGKGAGEPLYWYELANAEWQEALQDISRRAYIACGGSGYGRIDIRTPTLNECDPYVLEVNANCGLSFGKGSSSLGEVLELSGVSPASFVTELLDHARSRFSVEAMP
ncbi:hypothetical protein HDU67_003551 [Dinochytrium kinnereticum]|nr:hypothetical protein HDU67_003551 [Dinochytrium kinnereticum]